MRLMKQAVVLYILICSSGIARAQNYYDEEKEPPRRTQAMPASGFWPSDRMIDLFIDRVTEDMSRTYNFDEDQLYNVRSVFKERLPTWLNDNRGELMQLTNGYVEAILDTKAPNIDWVAKWSQQALPILEGFSSLVEDVSEDMRPFLTDEQQGILDSQLEMARTGINFTSQRIGHWAEGGFNPRTDWIHGEDFDGAEKKRREGLAVAQDDASRAAQGLPPEDAKLVGHVEKLPPGKAATADSRRAANNDEWKQYVDNFVRRYKLNDTQQADAHKILRFQQERRDKYLRRRGSALADARLALKQTDSDRQRTRTQQTLTELERPLDNMFTQLKEKLERIPTRQQRVAATQSRREGATQESPASDQQAVVGGRDAATP
ncbi:MAG: hypothetical protein ABIG44_13250 [Planctomycetota bacterium]